MAIPPRKIRNLPPALPASDDDVFAVSQMGDNGVATTRQMNRKQFQDDILTVVTAARQQLVDLANQSHEDIFDRLDAVEAEVMNFAAQPGPKGDKGDTGEKGDVGPKGDTGQSGSIGPIGPKGNTGPVGATGPQGATGPKGDTGSQGPKGDAAPALASLLGTINVTETATVALTAGIRRVTITTPAAWGVATGQNLIAFPLSVPSGLYAVHDVIVTGANTLSVGVSAPLLMVGSTYSIQCRLVRINT